MSGRFALATKVPAVTVTIVVIVFIVIVIDAIVTIIALRTNFARINLHYAITARRPRQLIIALIHAIVAGEATTTIIPDPIINQIIGGRGRGQCAQQVARSRANKHGLLLRP